MAKRALIETAVFPVAGRGTRFLPATKASPKEMLPVVDKPLIQYAVEEALAAGARRLVFITGASKRAIEDHFDSDQELEKLLESQGKSDLAAAGAQRAAQLRHLHLHPPAGAAGPGPCGAVRAAGGGQRAVLRAPGRRPDRRRGAVPEADGRRLSNRSAAASWACEEVPRSETDKYGIVEVEAKRRDQSAASAASSRSRSRPMAPSNLAVVGRYVLDAGDLRAPGEASGRAPAAKSS